MVVTFLHARMGRAGRGAEILREARTSKVENENVKEVFHLFHLRGVSGDQ